MSGLSELAGGRIDAHAERQRTTENTENTDIVRP
jgi:hypothetical protein